MVSVLSPIPTDPPGYPNGNNAKPCESNRQSHKNKGKRWPRPRRVECHTSCAKHGRKRKRPTHTTPDGLAVHRRRCLHGLCHGSQWPWLTSGMQAASSDIARARRALNHLHSLVSSGGANNSHCFMCVHSSSWPCSRYSEAIPARSSIMSVPGLPWLLKGKPRALCGRV